MEDHYIAWRQMHEQAALAHAGAADGPFSFCSYPWLLNPRAKSRLLHTEARFVMAQTVQQVRPQLRNTTSVDIWQLEVYMSINPPQLSGACQHKNLLSQRIHWPRATSASSNLSCPV